MGKRATTDSRLNNFTYKKKCNEALNIKGWKLESIYYIDEDNESKGL